MQTRSSVTVYGRGGASAGIPAEVDRLTRQFLDALRTAGFHICDATAQASHSLCSPDPAVATSDSPHSDLPVAAD